MTTFQQYLYGEHPQRAVVTVVAVGSTAAVILVPFGLFERGVSGLVGTSAFATVFGVLPGLAGGICGWYKAGFPAAVASGVAPGVVFYLIVTVGAAFNIGSFGGGDSPLEPFAFLLTLPSFLMATAGFAFAVALAILRH